jgi:hypothetical protein
MSSSADVDTYKNYTTTTLFILVLKSIFTLYFLDNHWLKGILKFTKKCNKSDILYVCIVKEICDWLDSTNYNYFENRYNKQGCAVFFNHSHVSKYQY